jgi:hypothetical protein
MNAENGGAIGNVGFSNRPFGVKRFQTIRHHGVDVARGLVLLFGIGTKAVPSWDSRTRWNNLLVCLAVRRTAGPSRHCELTSSIVREGHHSTARWSSSFLLSDVILYGLHAAAGACSRVQRNSIATAVRLPKWGSSAPPITLGGSLAIFTSRTILPCHPQCRRWSP